MELKKVLITISCFAVPFAILAGMLFFQITESSFVLQDLNSSLNELKGDDFVFWLALNNIAERDFNTQQVIGLNAAGVQCLQEWQRLNENCIVMQDTNESRVLACRK